MRSELMGNELFVAVRLVLSPAEKQVFEKLSEGMKESNKKSGKPVGYRTIMKMLMLDSENTDIIIRSLKNKIGFAYEIKDTGKGNYYNYLTLHEKKNI